MKKWLTKRLGIGNLRNEKSQTRVQMCSLVQRFVDRYQSELLPLLEALTAEVVRVRSVAKWLN